MFDYYEKYIKYKIKYMKLKTNNKLSNNKLSNNKLSNNIIKFDDNINNKFPVIEFISNNNFIMFDNR